VLLSSSARYDEGGARSRRPSGIGVVDSGVVGAVGVVVAGIVVEDVAVGVVVVEAGVVAADCRRYEAGVARDDDDDERARIVCGCRRNAPGDGRAAANTAARRRSACVVDAHFNARDMSCVARVRLCGGCCLHDTSLLTIAHVSRHARYTTATSRSSHHSCVSIGQQIHTILKCWCQKHKVVNTQQTKNQT
jgi:hypothetical protein